MRRKIPLLRGLAILAVLIGHAALWGIEPLNPPAGSPLSVDPWTRLQFELLAAVVELSYFSVPAFFFGAGLFATFAVQKPGLRANAAFLRARTKGLLVPLGIWSVVAFGVAWVLGIPSMSAYARNRLALGQVEWGYFFPLAMLQMYLLTPWMVDQARRAPRRLLVLGLGVQVLVVAARGLGSLAGVLDVATLGAGRGIVRPAAGPGPRREAAGPPRRGLPALGGAAAGAG
jgi:fucose 4-O-acetylase-like acetyltransferase